MPRDRTLLCGLLFLLLLLRLFAVGGLGSDAPETRDRERERETDFRCAGLCVKKKNEK